MAIDISVVRRYCGKKVSGLAQTPLQREKARKRPFLGYEQFRAWGIIESTDLKRLQALRHFGDTDKFKDSLRWTDREFRDMIREIYSQEGVPASTMHEDVQWSMVEDGLFCDFRRPNSSGLILWANDIEQVPALVVLGESQSSKNAYSGRVSLGNEGSIDSIVVYANAAMQKVAGFLRAWFAVFESIERNEKPNIISDLLARKDESLEKMVDRLFDLIEDPEVDIQFPYEDILLVCSLRAIADNFRKIMREVDTPQEFLLKAVDMQLRSSLSHEIAHLLERRFATEHGNLLIKEEMELVAHLVQGHYVSPGMAFKALCDRSINIEQVFPSLYKDLEIMHFEFMLEKEEYLAKWAFRLLREMTMAGAGVEPGDIFNPTIIRQAVQAPILRLEHIPIIEAGFWDPEGECPERENNPEAVPDYPPSNQYVDHGEILRLDDGY